MTVPRFLPTWLGGECDRVDGCGVSLPLTPRPAPSSETAAEHRPAHGGYPGHPRGGGMDRIMGYDVGASLAVHGVYPPPAS